MTKAFRNPLRIPLRIVNISGNIHKTYYKCVCVCEPSLYTVLVSGTRSDTSGRWWVFVNRGPAEKLDVRHVPSFRWKKSLPTLSRPSSPIPGSAIIGTISPTTGHRQHILRALEPTIRSQSNPGGKTLIFFFFITCTSLMHTHTHIYACTPPPPHIPVSSWVLFFWWK